MWKGVHFREKNGGKHRRGKEETSRVQVIGEMGKGGGGYKRSRDVDKIKIWISEKATKNHTINYLHRKL